jgi:hypothetical protein
MQSAHGPGTSGLGFTVLKKIFYNDEERFRPAIGYSLAIVAVCVAGYLLYANRSGTVRPVEASLKCATPGCSYTDSRKLEYGEAIPSACPKCGKNSVYPAQACPKCGTPNVLNSYLKIKGPTKCSKCGAELRYGG